MIDSAPAKASTRATKRTKRTKRNTAKAGAKSVAAKPYTRTLPAYLAKHLAPWFAANQREMEWRRTRDPYAIWVSEIMLQQTRVETVHSYYSRFLRRFPDVATLAAADQEEVLEAWSGLGYYRRARLLHKGARFVLEDCAGVVPGTEEGLREVPGIGRYTAGAIASIAYDRPAALVDGNVARVFSRVLALAEPKQQAATAAVHWQLAGDVLKAGSPRVLAQALMELGALVCTPTSPKCAQCPVRRRCKARSQGLTDTIPAPRKKIAQPVDRLWALAVYWKDHLLFERRPADGLLAGMWCLPLIARESADAARPSAAQLKQALPLGSATPRPRSAEVKHVFTHRVWLMRPCVLTIRRRPKVTLDAERYAWIPAGKRPAGGLPKATEKVLVELERAQLELPTN